MTYSRDEQEGDDPAASAEIYEASSQVTCLVHSLWIRSNNRLHFAFMIWMWRLAKVKLVVLLDCSLPRMWIKHYARIQNSSNRSVLVNQQIKNQGERISRIGLVIIEYYYYILDFSSYVAWSYFCLASISLYLRNSTKFSNTSSARSRSSLSFESMLFIFFLSRGITCFNFVSSCPSTNTGVS